MASAPPSSNIRGRKHQFRPESTQTVECRRCPARITGTPYPTGEGSTGTQPPSPAFVRRCLEDPAYAVALGGRAQAFVLTQLGATVKRYRKPTFTKPAPVDLRHEIATQCQVVIEALAD